MSNTAEVFVVVAAVVVDVTTVGGGAREYEVIKVEFIPSMPFRMRLRLG